MNIFVSILASFFAGVFGAMGLGGGSVLIIYLTVFAGVNQLTAQGINLIFFLPTALVAIFIYSKKRIIKWKNIIPIMVFGAIGTLISSFFVGMLNANFIKIIFGLVIVVYGFYEIFGKDKAHNSK